jgi:sirohydrochlorin cobaltochelatase
MIGLIVAAHGDGDNSEANRGIRELTHRAAKLLGVSNYTASFHRGTPGFQQSLEELTVSEVVVVPLMAAAGYYSQTVLPRELRKAPSDKRKVVVISEPVGTSPLFQQLATSRVRYLLDEGGTPETDCGLMVVGHGTQRHPRSRRSCEDLADVLGARFTFRKVSVAFLDESPSPQDMINEWRDSNLKAGIVLPFLIAEGTHSTVDIPESVEGLENILIDKALGTWGPVANIIVQRALDAEPSLVRGAS